MFFCEIRSSIQCICAIVKDKEKSCETKLIVIYRPPSESKSHFLSEFERVCNQQRHERLIIMGGLNFDISTPNNSVLSIASRYGLQPVIKASKVDSGKSLNIVLSTFPMDTKGNFNLYFTDHKAVCCSFR